MLTKHALPWGLIFNAELVPLRWSIPSIPGTVPKTPGLTRMPHDDDQSYFEHALVKINSGWSKNADRIRNQSCLELTSSNDYFIVSLHLIISNMRPDALMIQAF